MADANACVPPLSHCTRALDKSEIIEPRTVVCGVQGHGFESPRGLPPFHLNLAIMLNFLVPNFCLLEFQSCAMCQIAMIGVNNTLTSELQYYGWQLCLKRYTKLC